MILPNMNNAAFTTAAVIDSGSVVTPYSNGCVVRTFSSQAGVLKIYYIDANGTARQAVSDVAVSASDLKSVVIRMPLSPVKVTFTPNAATPGNVTVEVIPFRH